MDFDGKRGVGEGVPPPMNGGDSACPPGPPLRIAMGRELPVWVVSQSGAATVVRGDDPVLT